MREEIPFIHHIEERTMEELKPYFHPEVFLEYCKACQHYSRIWTCPPYNFDIAKMLGDYKYSYIIGSKLYIKELGAGFKELLNNRDMDYVTGEIYKAARRVLDEKLVGFEKNRTLVLFAGRCLACSSCTRDMQLPCIHGEKAHYSLESLGYNVSAISEDILGDKILWAKDSLPEYFIFVSAILSHEKMDVDMSTLE